MNPTRRFTARLAVLALPVSALQPATAAPPPAGTDACPAFLNHDFRKLHAGETINLCQAFAGRPLLIVNTASHCGFTPQFTGLESVHRKFQGRGLAVVGFASDDFNQEAASEAQAATTCFINFGVTFTMLAPQHVKGPLANPVFRELGRQTEPPDWNFNKYLVSADGTVVRRLGSRIAPDSPTFSAAIDELLKTSR